MMRKSKKLIVTFIASILLIGGISGTGKIVSAASNPCIMVKIADNLGQCNLSYSSCNGIMSRYKCSNHYLDTHTDTRCTSGHIDCTHPYSH